MDVVAPPATVKAEPKLTDAQRVVDAFAAARAPRPATKGEKGRVGRDAGQLLGAGASLDDLLAAAADLGAGDFANLTVEYQRRARARAGPRWGGDWTETEWDDGVEMPWDRWRRA